MWRLFDQDPAPGHIWHYTIEAYESLLRSDSDEPDKIAYVSSWLQAEVRRTSNCVGYGLSFGHSPGDLGSWLSRGGQHKVRGSGAPLLRPRAAVVALALPGGDRLRVGDPDL